MYKDELHEVLQVKELELTIAVWNKQFDDGDVPLSSQKYWLEFVRF